MKSRQKRDKELAAIEVLRQTGVDVLEAALVARAALAAGRGRVRRAMACIAAGAETLKKREKTVTFERAVQEALEERRDRRARSVKDFRYMARRFMKRCKGLAKRRMRSITPQECAAYLRQGFDTPRQRNNARLILSGIFSTAVKHGWCAENPVRKVQPERLEEKRIAILTNEEIGRLMNAAEAYKGGICLAAVAIMLLAGVRPHECERLRWGDVRLPAAGSGASYSAEAKGVICITPQHSKTGGARCVTIHPPLESILRREKRANPERICPPNWRKLWTGLHKAAGFLRWQPDVLRHTFATHHLATFRSYAELQLEMGHRSAELLRTRYVAMEGIYRPGLVH
ncbi:MAG: tyrosine-type recombinase/integrase [Akkermansiaceae bacterium]|nr:tyrosine-type recombinase/integrase [Akkermansiaceae bacterium]